MVESMALIMDDSELRQRMGAKAARLKETLGTDHVMYLWEQCLDKVRGVGMADAEHHDVPLDERFAFGKNWADFLKKLTPERIEAAKKFFRESFPEGLEGKAFLDIGCGSGLFSLCAKELGAKVMSFDFDPDSVACTKDLKARFYAGDEDWDIFEGSVLDDGMMDKLGTFDVVYTWGVLHHTGEMWHAIENAADRVADNGTLYIAIYNDQGGYSKLWRAVKKTYVKSPNWFRTIMCAMTFLFMRAFVVDSTCQFAQCL